MSDELYLGQTGVQRPYDPDDEPNPANPGGVSNNQLRRQQADQTRAVATSTQRQGNPTAGYGGSAQQVQAARDANRANVKYAPVDNSLGGVLGRGAKLTGDIAGGAASAAGPLAAAAVGGPAGLAMFGTGKAMQAAGNLTAAKTAAPGTGGGGTDPRATNGAYGAAGTMPGAGGRPVIPESTAQAGINPAAPVTGAPAPAPATPVNQVTPDFTSLNEEMSGLRQARTEFMSQLDRLSGVDPFGNQAFMQKATDRAVSQASGTAAMARGGAAALAGANRTAQGVQAQTAARGTQEVAEQGRRDAVQAAQLGIETIKGVESVGTQLSALEAQKVNQTLAAAEQNTRAMLGGRELDQRERESLRNLATEAAKIDQQRYSTDADYRASVNANLVALYQSDNALKGLKMQVDAGENMSEDEWLMGIIGAAGGLAQGAMMASDRRAKFNIRDADFRDLQDYLGNSKGKLYNYKEPHKPGRRAGLNFGPMAQDLAKSKIGRTLVVDDGSGTLKVDTGRLALADHAALAALAAEVQKLKGSKK